MLVVKVELWPHGDSARAEEVASAFIANIGTGSWERGDYHAQFEAREGGGRGDTPPFYGVQPRHPVLAGEGFVKGFERLGRGAWSLVAEALFAAGIWPKEKES